ncbi:hypothetical protein [Allorhizocola rhizosphaerae]|uniref:hypothetical protein n=1 Tax=Allorhizocola rhizosphaerae TaxID=1872709 RepID=UPI000E3E3C52|nr:hypothetical protein [Allorhizocola rhizosphaerae]
MRSRSWINVPINQFQEGNVIGWRPGERAGPIGSLLLAAHDTVGLPHFTGAVGTGVAQAMITQLK